MTTQRMMPGQVPYTAAELRRLYTALGDAADVDPGEQAEPPAWPGVDYDTDLLPSSWPGRRGEQAE
jgi:hypothetical protein